MTLLTNQDKIAIINQHKRNLEYTRYGVYLSLVEENASDLPDQERTKMIEKQLSEIDTKLLALDKEILSLESN